jgi:hypothetical protein
LRSAAGVEGGGETPRGPTDADATMKTATKQEVVRRALQFFSLEKNWSNLYRVLDAIRDDLGGSVEAVKAQGWVPKEEIGRFTGTANNHTAAQGEARHGFDSGESMPNPMTLGEAATHPHHHGPVAPDE